MTHADGDLGDVTVDSAAEDFVSVFAGVASCPAVKAVSGFVLWGCAALGLPLDLVWILCGLFVMDFGLGIWLAVAKGQFSLRKFARGFAKIPVYTLVLLIGWLCQQGIMMLTGHLIPAPMWACGYLAMHDALSCLAKCDALGLPVPKLFKRILRRISLATEAHVEKALDAIDGGQRKGK